MKRLHKTLAAAGIAALMALPMQTAQAWWGGPGYGYGWWRDAYRYDPAYWYAPPYLRADIRRMYRYGPGYAYWRNWYR